MQVRHNTSLLEQAVAHVVRKASIPLLEAEAAAEHKRERATAFRRLATGVAIAVAAVGLGWGVHLATLPKSAASVASETYRVPGTQGRQSTPVPIPEPRISPERRSGTSVPTAEIEEPTSRQSVDQDPEPEPIVTTDFTKFSSVEIRALGRQWTIQVGHHFQSETDEAWDNAWCYTKIDIAGVAITADLAQRSSVADAPLGPFSTRATLDQIGISADDARELATRCPWLDNKRYAVSEIRPPLNQPIVDASEPQVEVVGDTLVYKGEIDGTFLARLLQQPFKRLRISSNGGRVDQALAAGRWLRGSGKEVLVADTCLSSCVFVLAGGITRLADPSGKIGVHRFFMVGEGDPENAVEAAQETTSDILLFLDEMQVDAALFHAMADVSSADIRYLDHSQLEQWRLLSLSFDVENQGDAILDPLATTPRTGFVRHPAGSVKVFAVPDEKGIEVATLQNSTPVQILGSTDRWYEVQSLGGLSGFTLQTGIKVDQFVSIGFQRKFIQIKSFPTLEAAAEHIRASTRPLAAYLATNGWFAITLDHAYEDEAATVVLNDLKSRGEIPADSFKTYGNTYVAKVCCD